MIIKIGDYNIIPSEAGGTNFDLELNVVRKKKSTGENYDSESTLGYGMPLDRCIKIIIHRNLSLDESVVGFDEYINRYVKERDKISILLQVLDFEVVKKGR